MPKWTKQTVTPGVQVPDLTALVRMCQRLEYHKPFATHEEYYVDIHRHFDALNDYARQVAMRYQRMYYTGK